jgi:hypothetical protein
MKKCASRDKKKKAYEKPVLRIVDISAGTQVLATGCKFSFGTTSNPSAVPCTATPCYAPGS